MEISERKPVYLCDHTKAKTCPKTFCFFTGAGTPGCTCFGTTRVEYAKIDDYGNPCIFDPAAVIGE